MGKPAHKPRRRTAVVRDQGETGEPRHSLGMRVAWVVAMFAWLFVTLSLLSLDPADPPFYLYRHYMDVHDPYRHPEPYARRFTRPGSGRGSR